jgi:ATP-dependent DNA ligase
MEYITLYNKARTGATRVWQIGVEGDRVSTKFGQLDGALQEVTDYGYAKNEGKKNYISAEEDAHNLAERMLLKKRREGYSEELPGNEEEFNPFATPFLPERLSFYKPQNSLPVKLEKKLASRDAWVVRKYDGEMMVLVHHLDGSLVIYSRKMLRRHHHEVDEVWGDRFPHIMEALARTPPGTILLGELVSGDDFSRRWQVAQVMKSLTPRALSLQEEYGPLHFVVWDVAWWRGEQLLGKMQYRYRMDVVGILCAARGVLHEPDMFLERQYDNARQLLQLAKDEGWEGFVVVDPCSTYGDRGFNLRGKPDRPDTCGKLKPTFEDDFIARWDPEGRLGSYGSGKYTGLVGSVALFQILDGKEVYICDCGNGFTAEFLHQNSQKDSWPKVLKVEYSGRTYVRDGDDTNALQFPRFVEERDDKMLEDCEFPQF